MNAEINHFLTAGRKLFCFVVMGDTVRVIRQVSGRFAGEETLPRQNARERYAQLRREGFEKW